MLKYLDDIYSVSASQIADQHILLFLSYPEKYKLIKDIIYKVVLTKDIYDDAVKTNYAPLITSVKEEYERTIQNVKLLLGE